MPLSSTICVFLIQAAWVVFVLVWFVLAWSAKRSSYREPLHQRIIYLVPGIVAIFIFQHVPVLYARILPDGPAFDIAGVVLTYLGIALCIWARLHLGGNWSAFVTIKQDHQFIDSGPYRWVRHPIYTGLLAAFAGSILAIRPSWGGVLTMGLIIWAFLFKIRQEENLMLRQFPDAYAQYMARVKRLIPFVL